MLRLVLALLLLPALLLPVLAQQGFHLPDYPPEVMVYPAGEVVPLQPLATLLGGTLTRDLLSGQVTLARQGHTFTCAPRATAATADGKPLSLPIAPVMRHTILYVPLRAMVTSLGGTLQPEGTANLSITLPGLAHKILLPTRVMAGDLAEFTDTAIQLYLMNADGSGLRQLTYSSQDNGIPVRSPDGNLWAYGYGGALYVRMRNIPAPVCLLPARHEERQRRTNYAHLVFTADSKKIIYCEQPINDPHNFQYDQQMRLGIVEVMGGAVVPLSENAQHLCVNATHALLAFSDWGTTHVADITGNDICTLPGAKPDISPDGTRVLYSANANGRTLSLYIRSGPQAGTTLTAPQEANPNLTESCFLPDGKSIVYYDGNQGLHIIDAELKNSRSLAMKQNSYPVDLQCAPDGAQIFFNVPYNAFGLYVINVDGTELKQLTDNLHVSAYALSPDGKQILFTASL